MKELLDELETMDDTLIKKRVELEAAFASINVDIREHIDPPNWVIFFQEYKVQELLRLNEGLASFRSKEEIFPEKHPYLNLTTSIMKFMNQFLKDYERSTDDIVSGWSLRYYDQYQVDIRKRILSVYLSGAEQAAISKKIEIIIAAQDSKRAEQLRGIMQGAFTESFILYFRNVDAVIYSDFQIVRGQKAQSVNILNNMGQYISNNIKDKVEDIKQI